MGITGVGIGFIEATRMLTRLQSLKHQSRPLCRGIVECCRWVVVEIMVPFLGTLNIFGAVL